MSSVSTKPAKGMRDFLPEDVRRREYVVGIIREVYEAHGFEPLETPTLESIETLLGKYGDEGNQLIFRVMKRGAQLQEALEGGGGEDAIADLGLRYDLTVPLARVVAEYGGKLPPIFKRYQIQPVWRADRPARGRFREFYQCDVDVAGTTSLAAEAEVMSAVSMALDRLGFEEARIRLNHRGVLFGLIEAAGVPASLAVDALVAVDKVDKIGWEGVAAELMERGIAAAAVAALEPLLGLKGADAAATLAALEGALASVPKGLEGVAALRELLALASCSGAGRRVEVDPYLARGLSYYTGAIFEIASPFLAGSLGGGGRYDGLVGMFSGRDVPAVGFSLGLERLIVIMSERGMFPAALAPSAVLVAVMGSSLERAARLAADLRAQGVRVDLYPEHAKLGKQLKYAEGRGIRFVAICGSSEEEVGVVTLKDLQSGAQVQLPRAEVGGWHRAQ